MHALRSHPALSALIVAALCGIGVAFNPLTHRKMFAAQPSLSKATWRRCCVKPPSQLQAQSQYAPPLARDLRRSVLFGAANIRDEPLFGTFDDRLRRYNVSVRPLQEIGRFKLGSHDPLAHKFNQLDIPIDPKFVDPKPYMMMDGLLDPNNLTHFVTQEQWRQFDHLLKSGAFAIMGVSGSGKTRTVLEYLAEHWGFLFVVDTTHDGGIKDFGALFPFLKATLMEGEEHRESNEFMALSAFLCLLLGRMMLLDAVLESNKNMTPLQWLWVQLFPSYMLSAGDGSGDQMGDAIVKLVTQMMEADFGLRYLRSAIIAIESRLTKRLGLGSAHMFPCFIDEAQILLKQYEGYFPSNTGSQGRPLFSIPLRAFSNLVAGPVLSGTGMKMSSAIEALASYSTEKGVGETGRMYSTFPLSFGAECRRFLDRYVDLSIASPEEQETIVRVLGGRPRFSAAFSGRAVVAGRERDLMDVLHKFVVDMATGENAKSYEKGSFYHTMKNLHAELAIARQRLEMEAKQLGVSPDALEKQRNFVPIGDLIRVLDTVALRYAISGKPQRVPSEGQNVLQLIECGLCPLVTQGNDLFATIAEPLVVMAVCNYNKIESYQWHAMYGSTTSAQGFHFESAAMIAFDGGKDTLFSHHQALEEHPLIKGAGIELPPRFRGQWMLERRPGFPLGASYEKDKVTLDSWMANPTSTFYFPDEYTGADLVFFVRNAAGHKAIVMMQAKLLGEDLPQAGLKHAVATTDIQHVLLRKDNSPINTRIEERKRVLKLYQEQDLLNIGILVNYPGGSAAVTELKRRDYLFIAATGTPQFEQLFTKDFVDGVRAAKNP